MSTSKLMLLSAGGKLRSDDSVLARVREAVQSLGSQKTAAEKTNLPYATLQRILAGKSHLDLDRLTKIATAADVSVEFLLRGTHPRPRQALVAVEDADWINLAEIDIANFTETSEGPTLSRTPFRRDWLNKALGSTGDIFLARLPAPYEPLGLHERDIVFVQLVRERPLVDRGLYIWRRDTTLFVARHGEARGREKKGERYVASPQIGRGDGEAQPMGRILGVTMKGLA